VIVRELRIAARPETVFAYLTDPEKLVLWMGRKATLDARPGGVVRIDYNGFDAMRGEVVEIVPHTKFVFTWGWEGDGKPLPPGGSTVEFHLTSDGDGTLLRMVHRDLNEVTAGSHGEGWDHFLPRLSAVAAGVDPGPDSWAPRQAELAAAELRDLLRELRSLVERCPDERWTSRSTTEGWPASAVAGHALDHLALVDFAVSVSDGNPGPQASFTPEMLEEFNARNAEANAGKSRADVLAEVDSRGPLAVEALRAVSDDGIAQTVAMATLGGARVSALQVVQGPLLSDLRGHIQSFTQATLE
jgi:uncharacterized protein YndB with AHSA1/START domain